MFSFLVWFTKCSEFVQISSVFLGSTFLHIFSSIENINFLFECLEDEQQHELKIRIYLFQTTHEHTYWNVWYKQILLEEYFTPSAYLVWNFYDLSGSVAQFFVLFSAGSWKMKVVGKSRQLWLFVCFVLILSIYQLKVWKYTTTYNIKSSCVPEVENLLLVNEQSHPGV